MNPLRWKLHWQIFLALLLSIPIGLLARMPEVNDAIGLVSILDFIGTLFLNALKMIIVPLVISAVITGVAGSGAAALGRLGGKTVAYYLITSLLAVVVGLALVNVTQPGISDGQPAKDVLGLSADTEMVAERVGERSGGDIVDVFIRMVPTNIFSAASENGQLLGLIFFSLLFAYFMTRIEKTRGKTLEPLWEEIYEVMLAITNLIMRFAPLGVLALVGEQIAIGEVEGISNLIVFFVTVLAALLFHMFIVMPLILKFVARVSPFRMFKAASPAILTAFSTSSSSATIPITMDCVEENAGVPNRISSFVVPLGATVNMNGTALYECVAAMFIAQAYGLDLSLGVQFTIVVTALLTSIGVAGIPSASLVAIAVILGVIGLPAEGLGLILAVDRILDMFRTSVNVFGDACGAVIISKLEGVEGILEDTPVEKVEHAREGASS